MDTNNNRLRYLAGRYLDDTCTPAELQEFWRQIHDLEDEAPLREELQQLWQRSEKAAQAPPQGWEHTLQRIYSHAREWEQEQQVVALPPVAKRRVSVFRRAAVAASILLVTGLGGYFLLFTNTRRPDEIVKVEPARDVEAPKGTKAVITLSDGRKVYVDSAGSGTLAVQGSVKLVKLAGGQIAYQTATGETIKEMQYNTLFNPRGSKVIDMVLSDGSHVWLNAGSSITYPVAFAGNERKISMTGEAYFEVAHDKAKPFIVSKGEMNVEVLGTKFNVNVYDDEADIKVTLLEGSIRMQSEAGGQKPEVLKPGEQARVASGIKVVKGVDVEQVMAWKNGYFSFNNTDMSVVIRQIKRWYDVTVVNEAGIPSIPVVGKVQRDLTLAQMLNILQRLGLKMQYRIEEKKLIIGE